MSFRRLPLLRRFALLVAFVPLAASGVDLPRAPEVAADGSMVGRPTVGDAGVAERVSDIMDRQADRRFEQRAPRRSIEHESRRRPLPNPDAAEVAQWPPEGQGPQRSAGPRIAQTTSTNFLGATLTDTGAFPPDTMGAVGPTQYIVAVNGRVRSFNKSTGVADGVLNVDTDVFFASVVSPRAGTFTSDPRIRYDRLSGRWYVIIIDVPAGTGAVANKVFIAVSDTPTITASTVWTFFSFQPNANFTDYPTLGIDANALYIGGNIFSLAGGFVGTEGYVVRKSSLTSGGPIVVTVFPGLAAGAGAGPYTPQGVDNYDPAATEGYFIGVDNATFSTLMIRRVGTPGGTPTISANISLTVPTTTFPAKVPHLGNTGGTNGFLDVLDDRLFAAHIRNGRLWTAHNIRVSSAGVASTAAGARVGTRWYELQNLNATPSLVQSGTIFDSAAVDPVAYFIPSVMVSGQGHAAFGFTSSGNAARANAATTGRLAGDPSGTTQGPPANYTAAADAYNPPADPGGAGGRRWGDYSYTSLDPCDDMTMWTIQEFTQAANIYGVQAVKLLAPAPTVSCAAPTTIVQGASGNVTVTGGGFYNPPAAVDACRVALAAAAGAGVTVNSITFNSASSLTLNVAVSTGAATGARSITVTNPDGQAASNTNCLTIDPIPPTTITTLDRATANPVCATESVAWQATFAAPVTGVAPGNFLLSGGTAAAIIDVTGSGATRTVTANAGTAAATLGLSLANSAGVTPAVSNTPFAGQTFTVNALPAVATVTGGGAFCSGTAGAPVGLSASQSGVNYQLLRNGNPVGAPLPGTGAALDFGAQSTVGTYTVTAVDATTTCGATMSGNAVVSVNPTPALDAVTAAPVCTGGTTNIALASTPPGATFAWSAALASGSVTGFADGTGNAIAQPLSGAGVVTYTVTPTLAACAATGSPVQQTVADPAIVTTQLPNTAPGANYSQAISAPGALTGATFALTSGALPNGLSLSPAGVVSGIPTQDGSFTFTVTASATGIASCTSAQAYTVVVGDLLFRDGFE